MTIGRSPFHRRIASFLMIEAFNPEGLKDLLDDPSHAEAAEDFRSNLRNAIEKQNLDLDTYVSLTGDVFEDTAEYNTWLRDLNSYLFEGGPEPDH